MPASDLCYFYPFLSVIACCLQLTIVIFINWDQTWVYQNRRFYYWRFRCWWEIWVKSLLLNQLKAHLPLYWVQIILLWVDFFRFYHLPCVVDCLTIPAIYFLLTRQMTMIMTMTISHDHSPWPWPWLWPWPWPWALAHGNNQNRFMIITVALTIGHHRDTTYSWVNENWAFLAENYVILEYFLTRNM